jgi:hypothetical protein
VTERKPKTDTDRTPAVLDEFARDIVNGGNVIGIDCVPHAQTIGEECGAEQRRMLATATERPRPGGEISDDQKPIEDGEPATQMGAVKAKHLYQQVRHGASDRHPTSLPAGRRR